MKVAGAELLGLRAYREASVPGLHLPLMTLLDYRGHRIIVSCLLPLSAATLCYGSADGASSVLPTALLRLTCGSRAHRALR
jgi:hypothetical protein